MTSYYPDVAGIAHRAHAQALLRNDRLRCRECGRSNYKHDRHVLKCGLCPECKRRMDRETAAAS